MTNNSNFLKQKKLSSAYQFGYLHTNNVKSKTVQVSYN